MAGWVLLHGFMGAPESFAGIAGALAPAEVLAPRLAGHGRPVAALSASFEAEIERILGIVREQFSRPAHLLGYSLGARLGLGLLCRSPQSFETATLIGVHPGLEDAAERRAREQQEGAWRKILREQDVRAFVDYWEKLPLFESQAKVPVPRLRAQRASRLMHTAAGLEHALSVLGLHAMPSYWNELSGLDLPVSLVVGERDHKFIGLAERMLLKLPRGRLSIVPGVGHNVVLEAPEYLAGPLGSGRLH